MNELIYDWMKNLAVFCIFLTVAGNLMPDGRYSEHIRFFMGLILILLILSPLLQVFQLQDAMEELFQEKMQEEEYLDSAFGDLQLKLKERQERIQGKLQEKIEEEAGKWQGEESSP